MCFQHIHPPHEILLVDKTNRKRMTKHQAQHNCTLRYKHTNINNFYNQILIYLEISFDADLKKKIFSNVELHSIIERLKKSNGLFLFYRLFYWNNKELLSINIKCDLNQQYKVNSNFFQPPCITAWRPYFCTVKFIYKLSCYFQKMRIENLKLYHNMYKSLILSQGLGNKLFYYNIQKHLTCCIQCYFLKHILQLNIKQLIILFIQTNFFNPSFINSLLMRHFTNRLLFFYQLFEQNYNFKASKLICVPLELNPDNNETLHSSSDAKNENFLINILNTHCKLNVSNYKTIKDCFTLLHQSSSTTLLRCDARELLGFTLSKMFANINHSALKMYSSLNNKNLFSSTHDDSHTCVIKILHKTKCTDNEYQQLQFESEFLSRTKCENIVSLFLVFENELEQWMFLEFAPLGDLHTATKSKILPETVCRWIVFQVLVALKELHDTYHVVHCDLKPHNILLYRDDYIYTKLSSRNHLLAEEIFEKFDNCRRWNDIKLKLTDFGLSQYLSSENKKLEFKYLKGTQGYLSPELLKNMAFDEKVDMWAVGVIAFTLLAGYEPFYPAGSCLNEEVKFDPRYWSHIPDVAKDFLRKLLEVDPAKRSSAAEALNHSWLNMYSYVP